MAEGIVIGNLQIPIAKGQKGDTGEAGKILSIDLVMLSPTATPYATNTGTQTDAVIELGVPRGIAVSTVNINASGELVFTFNDGTTSNVGQVVGKGISEVTVTEDFDFVVTYTDGTSVIACNLEDEVLGTINDIFESYYTKTEIDNKGFITKEVDNLTNYTLKTSTGSSIELSINTTTYVMTLNLKNASGTVISTGTVDLPLETMVVGATYDNTNKKIVLTLKNGTTIDVPVADLIAGLVSETTFNNAISNINTQISQINTTLGNKVDKVSGKDLSTNDFTNELKTKLEGLENYDDTEITEDMETLKQSQEEQDEQIEELQAENEALYNDHPDITDTGTDLTLQGTGDLKMKVDVGGNSTQVQYEGYNKLSAPADFNATVNNVTIQQSGGIYKLNGTASQAGFIFNSKQFLNEYTIQEGDYLQVLNDGISNNTLSAFNIGFTDNTNMQILLDVKNKIMDLSPYVGKTTNVMRCYCENGATFNNMTAKPMIVNSSTQKDFEPYTNNLPIPSPNQKSDINNVEGDVEVKAKNKNRLAYPEDFNATVNNMTVQQSGGIYKLNGTASQAGFIFNSKQFLNEYTIQEGDYLQVLNDGISNNALSAFNIGFTDNTVMQILLDVTNKIIDLSPYVGKTTYVMRCYCENGATFNNMTAKPMIVNSSTQVDYVPHAENTVTFPLSQGQKLMLGDTLEDDGIHHKRGQTTFTGTTATLSDAKTNGAYLCDQKTSGNLSGQTLTFDSAVTNAVIEYELATETIEVYTQTQQTAYNNLKEMQSYYDLTYVVGSSNNAQPILTVQAKKSIKEITGADLSNYQTKITSTNKLNSDLVDDTNQTNKFVTTSEKNTWNAKQNTTDNNLATTNKNITSAINEVNSIAKGANQALSYASYSAMITAFSSASSTDYNVGQNIYIETLEVPDLWVYKVESTSSSYTYTTDSAFTTALETNGYVQVGYYKLSALETQKVDLTNYVEFTDYASSSTAGVVKISILTQSQYDALQAKDTNTYYYIVEE